MQKHTLFTRIAHMGLALAIVVQLLTSLVFVAPAPGRSSNLWWDVHQYGGLAAFGFVLLFWLELTARQIGTSAALLFPWFSGPRLRALWADTRAHLKSGFRFRLPPYDENAPLAGAVHGLGLLLVTAMATSGTIYYFINTGNPDAGGLVGIVMLVHKTLANLVWAYLIAHAGLAVIHHFSQNMSLKEMWTLRTRQP